MCALVDGLGGGWGGLWRRLHGSRRPAAMAARRGVAPVAWGSGGVVGEDQCEVEKLAAQLIRFGWGGGGGSAVPQRRRRRYAMAAARR